MAQNMNLGKHFRPLRNVAALAILIKGLQKRSFGLPGMATFHGPTGYGKTFAAAHAASALDAIYISVQDMWTKKTLMTQILKELSIAPAKTRPEMMLQVGQGLAAAGRPLIIDEADYAIDRGMIKTIRDCYDASQVPIVLIGMETLPQKIEKWEVVDGRMHSWVPAEPADIRDARMLAEVYASGVSVDEALLKKIVKDNKGSVRRISVDLAYVLEQSNQQGVTEMTLDAWGDAPFLRGVAPAPRRGL